MTSSLESPTTPLRATYRLPLGPGLDLAQARTLVPYLADLGASHLELTPAADAPAWPELGGEEGMRLLEATAQEHGLGLVSGRATVDPGFTDELGALFAAEPLHLPVTAFHAANRERAEHRPQALLATTPGDDGRSADVRARLGVLGGIGEAWTGAVRTWLADNAQLRRRPDGPPTPAEELLVYEALIGAWPIGMDRLGPYLSAAIDEPHAPDALRFTETLLGHGPFRYGFDGWAARVADVGRRAGLGQLLLALTCPGVPGIYGGDELEYLALGGPDTPPEVDWAARRSALRALQAGGPVAREHTKLHLIWRALALRAEVPEAFGGAYTPIPAGEGVCAFLRGSDVIVAVTLGESVTGAGGWALPAEAAGTWVDVLTGVTHELPGGASLAAVMGPEGRTLLRRAS